MWPGIIPILISSGVIKPGQLGPSNKVFLPPFASFSFMRLRTSSISRTGIPSVIQIAKSKSASTASQIAAAAPAGGT